MRLTTLKLLTFGALGMAMAVSGCDCGGTPKPGSLDITFRQPLDGAVLTANDEMDAATPGFQYDVVVDVKDSNNQAVELESAKLSIRGADATQFTDGPAAQIDGQKITFPRATLTAHANVLKVEVTEKGGAGRSANRLITVSVGQENPTVELTSPAAGAVVKAGDDADASAAGFQIGFVVRAPGMTGSKGTVYCDNVCGVVPTEFTMGAEDTLDVPVTLKESACEQLQATCYAVVKTTAGQTVTSAAQTFSLDTEAPKIEIASPAAPVASHTFQVAATVSCAENGTTATLTSTGQQPVTATVSNGTVVFPGVSVDSDGAYQYELTITDKGGNTTVKAFTAVVDSDAPTLAVTLPSTITTDANNDPADGVQAMVTATVNSEPVGAEVYAWPSVTGVLGRRVVAKTATVGPDRVATFTVNLAEGANSVRVCTRNLAGVETCESRSVTVNTGRGTCRITSPSYSVALKPSATPAAVKVDSANGTVSVRVFDAAGQQVGTAATATAVGGVANVPVPLPMGDGEYFLQASCPGGVSQRLPVAVDGTPPALEAGVAGQETVDITLGTDTVDTSTLPGTQVVVEIATEPWASVSAAITGCDSTANGNGRADSAGALTLRDFTIPATGQCTLTVNAVDSAGNQTTTTRNITAALVSGDVTFVTPSTGALLTGIDGTPRSGGGITLGTVLLNVATLSGDGTLKLLRGTTEVGSKAVTAGAADVTFNDVDLDEGVNVLRAELTLASGGTSCAVAVVTVNTAPPPAIALTNPGAPLTMTLGIDFGPNEPGIQRPLNYAPAMTVPVDICTDVPVVSGAGPCRGDSALFTLLKDAPANTASFTYPDGKYSIRAVLSDGSAESDAIALTVDSIRPVVKAVTFQGDADGNRVLNAAELPPSQKPIATVTVDGAEGQPVTIVDAATNTIVGGPANVTNGAATVTLTGLSNGGQGVFNLIARVSDVAGNANNTTQARPFDPLNSDALVTLTVDQAAPTVAVSSPTKTLLGPADDGNQSTPAFELRIVVAVPSDAVKVRIDRTAPVADSSMDLTPQNLAASWDFPVAASTSAQHAFTITATDAVGNVTVINHSVTVDLQAPVVTLTSPTNNGSYTNAQIPVTVSATGAPNATATVRTQVSAQTYTLDSIVLDANGSGTKSVYFPNGVQTVTVEVTDAAGNKGTASAQITVTSTGCSILISQPSSNPAVLSRQDDANQVFTDGLQTTIAGTSPNCPGLAVTLKKNGSTAGTTTAGTTNGAFTFSLTLNDGEQATFTVEMTDPFSMVTSVTRDLSADLTPPTIGNVSPAGSPLFFVAAANEHLLPTPQPGYVQDNAPGGNAEFDLSFLANGALNGTATVKYLNTVLATQTVDAASKTVTFLNLALQQNTAGSLVVELADAAGNVATYSAPTTVDVQAPAAPTVTRTLADARRATVNLSWTSSGDDGSVGSAAGYVTAWTTDLVVPGGVLDDITFFTAGKTEQNTVAATSLNASLTGLPPISTYYIYVRAKDDVGNYSPLVTANAAMPNLGNSFALSNPGSGSGYGFASAAGDLNGGGQADLVVGAPAGTPGFVYVYYGEAGLTTGAPQTLIAPDATANWFGCSVSVGNSGDAAGEGRPDLLVGSMTWNPGAQANRGRAFLYFGQNMAQLDPTPVEFRGTAGAGATFFGRQVAIINDINGDGLSEVVIAATGENGNLGKVYLWYGRTKANWLAARTANESGIFFVPTSSADKVFDGDSTIQQLGRAWGFVSLGDVNGDGTNDFSIPASMENSQKVYIHSGAAVNAKSGAVTTADAVQVLSQPSFVSTGSNGFGSASAGGFDFLGTSAKDVVFTYPLAGKIFIYEGGQAPAFSSSPAATITATAGRRLGYSAAAGDFTGDGHPELAAGESFAPGGAAYLFVHRGTTSQPYDTATDLQLHQARVVGNALGGSIVFGDFDGDGKQDMAIGDRNANSVTVWY